MTKLLYLDRVTGKVCEEEIYGKTFIHLFYGEGIFSKVLAPLLMCISKFPFFSYFYGWLQKRKESQKKIVPFIKKFDVDPSEFLLPVEAFSSFNDFFIRKLKKEVRPFSSDPQELAMPADGRYLVYPDIQAAEGFWVKGKKFSLAALVQDPLLANEYAEGSMALIRLCPTDYHRFHFPCSGKASPSRLINGSLYSVNPMALKKNIEILTENKRMLTAFETEAFGKVLYIEVGATNVGSICQTFTPEKHIAKGEEKGFFEFGGSCLILLFQKGKITFSSDLIESSCHRMEVRGLLGQSLGRSDTF